MKEEAKYRKEDRHICSVADEFHNKSHYVFLYAPHLSLKLILQRNQPSDDGSKKKTGTRAVWPTNSSQTQLQTRRPYETLLVRFSSRVLHYAKKIGFINRVTDPITLAMFELLNMLQFALLKSNQINLSIDVALCYPVYITTCVL